MEEVIKVDDCVGNIGDYDIPIHNAIIVPENVTNGDVIKAMFPDAEIKEIMGSFDKDKLLGYRTWLGGRSQDYFLDWWNEPYNSEKTETLQNIIDKMRADIAELDNKVCQQFLIEDVDKEVHHAYQDCLKIIDKYKVKNAPQRKIGKWVKHDTGHSIYYDCSLCGCVAPCTETADKILWKMANYCPDCGAKMEKENCLWQ